MAHDVVSSFSRSIEQYEGGCIAPRHRHVGPTVSIQVTAGHSINCSFPIAKRPRGERLAFPSL